MKITYTQGKGYQVVDIPEGNVVLFFARDREYFIVIHGPENTCLPKNEESSVELWDAKIAFVGADELDKEAGESPVRHGHKYKEGGGFIEFGEGGPSNYQQIFFRLLSSEKMSTFNGTLISKVYIVK